LIKALTDSGYTPVALTRRISEMNAARTYEFGMTVESLVNSLNGCDCVVHLAARVHNMTDSGNTAVDEIYARENTQATQRIAQAAVAAGVKHFVFMSTAKVYGEHTSIGQPFRVGDSKQPHGPYAHSKHLAEEWLLNAETEGMNVTILRPPLVYGPGVGANFAALMRLSASGFPLPLGAIKNKRSLVSTTNLHNLIVSVLNAEAKGKQVFNVADGEDVSTAELIDFLAKASGRTSRLFNVPQSLLERALKFVGKADIANRICGNFQISIAETCTALNWRPPLDLANGILQAVTAKRDLAP
jgi:nucleoside-diphosphate-sugar epimerase